MVNELALLPPPHNFNSKENVILKYYVSGELGCEALDEPLRWTNE
jgi:hypothetical protein|tara:strand:+ start:992 stop:1126 length:135 start_codon:yes stop_codon:yes gene_type:complete